MRINSPHMRRDGHCKSLWQHGMPSYSPSNKNFPYETDVVIVGGGITGVTTALQLQRAGKSCVLIEAQELGFGTTGGTTAHLNTILDTPYYQIKKDFGADSAQLVAQLSRNALELIKRNVEEFNIDCQLEEKAAYVFALDDKQATELAKIIEGTKEVGIQMEYCASLPVPIPFTRAGKVEGQGQIHATRYLFGLAAAFENAGGRIVQNCRVTDVEKEKDETVVDTVKGKIKTNYVVYATHIPPGVNILHFRCAPYRSYALGIKLKGDKYPTDLAYDLHEPYHYYRTHEVDGIKYLIAGGEDHKTAHEENTDKCFAKLESYVRQYFDVEQVEFRWSSQYFESTDGLPYIGHLPGNPENMFVATGFAGNGLTYGTASALVLADLVCSSKSEYKQLLNPNRVKPVAGFETFVKEQVDVVSVFVGKRIGIEKIDGAIELTRGEAKVVKYEGTSLALYKDDAGQLFSVNPSCPHVKCVVVWNSAEKSWDCPCHGSRFSFTGELLTAPARKNLEVIELNNL
jgi:glycine/D-amino acid oxidase-like deaminating enzyme/nitrite reductase/ring-hydroxylating ferredoxin subunit